jgi:hypothetical protein
MSIAPQPDTTSIYAVSVDSRSRPVGQPDYKYDVDLKRVINRVKTVQLGSIQFKDCREAFTADSEFFYSEPMTIDENCYVTVQETTTVLNKTTCASQVSTHQINILLPPSLNAITAYTVNAGNQDTVTTSALHGLDFVQQYYGLVGLSSYVAGAHYPRALQTIPMPAPFPTSVLAPVLDSTTVTVSSDSSYTYAANYLDALNTTTLNNDLRHFSAAPAYNAYIVAERPLPVELFSMVNAALNDRVGAADISGTVVAATNASPIVITTAAPHQLVTRDQVTVIGVTGNTAANGTFLITVTGASTFELDNSAGNGAYAGGGSFVSIQGLSVQVAIGFDDQNNRIFARGETVTKESSNIKTTIEASLIIPTDPGVSAFAAKIGFIGGAKLSKNPTTTIPSTIRRQVSFSTGTYDAMSVATNTQQRLNPLTFLQDDTAQIQRTLQLQLSNGSSYSLLLLRGRYTANQMAVYLNTFLNGAPTRINVTFDGVADTFTFTNLDGLPFALLFSGGDNAATAAAFGFNNVDYVGQTSYTSPNPAWYGVGDGGTFPLNLYTMLANTDTSKYTLASQAPLVYISTSGTVTDPDVAWLSGGTTNDGPIIRWQPGDIVCATQPEFSGTITAATNASPIVITTAAAHLLTTGDVVAVAQVLGNTAANGNWQVTVTGATTFELDGSSGNGAYTSGGLFYSLSVAGVDSNLYTVVVENEMATDALALGTFPTDLATTVELEATPSNSSTVDIGTVNEALQTPGVEDIWLLTLCSRRVFELYFPAPGGLASNLGFPPGSWPPNPRALQQTGSPTYATYDSVLNRVPVASSYQSPYCWELEPSRYILMLLRLPCGSQDQHTHTFQEKNEPIFAKLYLSAPFLHISEEVLYYSFAGYKQMSKLSVEFQNPDGSAVDFNGQPHTFSLLFTMYQDQANMLCF